MDVREKLVELICRFCSGLAVSDITPPYGYENLADFMISNGVTVQEDCKYCAEATQNCIVKLQEQIAELRSAQEWVSVKDKMPDKDGYYLIFTTKYFTPDHIDEIDHKDGFEISGYCKRYGFLSKNGIHAKYWQPLPHPPKGE